MKLDDFKSEIEVRGECPECGEPIKFPAYLMRAYRTDRGICYTSNIDPDQDEIPPEALYSYDTKCPFCGWEIEGVLSEKEARKHD